MANAATRLKKYNFSEKRLAILECIQSTDCHPTAEWVFEQLKDKYPNISLGTIYRNINHFKDLGMVGSVGIVDNHEHFDGNIAPHGHFYCKKCGRIYDVMDDHVNDDLMDAIEEQLGVRIDSHDLRLYGLCEDCSVEKSQ